MSGVFGVVRFDGRSVQKKEMQTMLKAMQNRSNDAEGIWIDSGIGFGHTMLWTTPESLYENQPQVSKDGNVVLTADARIDNRDELIEQLQINQQDFSVIIDADLILWSYEKWGENCPEYLLGDFAIAIWDKQLEKLFCFRDRFGIKPFYFYFSKKAVYFASNIDLLYRLDDKPVLVNDAAVRSFSRYATIGYEATMYKNIFRVPPAYLFVFAKEGLNRYRYWFPEKIKIDYMLSFEEAKKKVTDLLRNAVAKRLRVYGDFACELSGGLDSTAVSLLAKDITNTQFKSFSMRYRSYSCDEWEYTQEAINTLKCTPVVLDIDQMDVSKKYHLYKSVKLNRHWPLYGSFIHNYALGEKMIENDIRVCLTGHGGDHVFIGSFDPILDYLKHFHFKYAMEEFKYLDENIFAYIYRRIKSIIPKGIKLFIKKYFFRSKNSTMTLPENFTDYWKVPPVNSDTTQSNLYATVGRQHVMHTDNNHYRILESSHSIEFRHPFFDTELIEYLLSLPNYYKYRQGMIKVVLREALKNIYPSAIYKRKDKAEFSEALMAQMNEVEMNHVWDNSILIKNDLIDDSMLEKLLCEYNKKSIDAEAVGNFWRMTTLELWLKEAS